MVFAFFRLVGGEDFNLRPMVPKKGRDTWVIDAEPQAHYKPSFKEARIAYTRKVARTVSRQ